MAKTEKADLQSVIRDNCKQLSANHQRNLPQLLIKHELLFDHTLGGWKTKPVFFYLKEENTKTWSSFPSAKNTQDTLIKEVERLCKRKVLKQQQASTGALPSLKVPIKNETVCFLSNFWEVTRG
jgi:hypothetical protein